MTARELFNAPEWRVIVQARPNVLLVVSPRARTAAMAALITHLPAPLHTIDAWPATGVPCEGTIVLHAIETLTPDRQRVLLACLRGAHGTVQIISLSTITIFPRVLAGAFLADLYYTLKSIRACATVVTFADVNSSSTRRRANRA
jgi:hypothetical protein